MSRMTMSNPVVLQPRGCAPSWRRCGHWRVGWFLHLVGASVSSPLTVDWVAGIYMHTAQHTMIDEVSCVRSGKSTAVHTLGEPRVLLCGGGLFSLKTLDAVGALKLPVRQRHRGHQPLTRHGSHSPEHVIDISLV
ncbi:hypothetical protein ECG_09364 [Echinococcus granulosus]|nr:hypothetical protein ECG_09364 [Echinococcus granulosus]